VGEHGLTEDQYDRRSPNLIHVLAIDDDPGVRQLIEDYLGDNDMVVTTRANGRELVPAMQNETFDIVLLDLKLPDEDGLKLLAKIREECLVPIIILTGRRDEADRVMGLELGADDYLTKPFSPRELLARIRALLRRIQTYQPKLDGSPSLRAYRFAGWELTVGVRRLRSPDGRVVVLTNNEFNLLVAFLASPQRLLSRTQLLDLSRLHGDEVYDRAIDVQVGRLRRKLGNTASMAMIRTERGGGYILDCQVEIVR
jgi:DNA-binding response OmpR family regulator